MTGTSQVPNFDYIKNALETHSPGNYSDDYINNLMKALPVLCQLFQFLRIVLKARANFRNLNQLEHN